MKKVDIPVSFQLQIYPKLQGRNMNKGSLARGSKLFTAVQLLGKVIAGENGMGKTTSQMRTVITPEEQSELLHGMTK